MSLQLVTHLNYAILRLTQETIVKNHELLALYV
ncbi:MAG: hypothetical protein ACI9V8_001922 [Urechidicola sp.]|jgi:hypothetical protein